MKNCLYAAIIAILFCWPYSSASTQNNKAAWSFSGDAAEGGDFGFMMRSGHGPALAVYGGCKSDKLYVQFDPSANSRLIASELLPHIIFEIDGVDKGVVEAYPEIHEVGEHLWVFATKDVSKQIYEDIANGSSVRLKLVGTAYNRKTETFQSLGPLPVDGRHEVMTKFIDRCFLSKGHQP